MNINRGYHGQTELVREAHGELSNEEPECKTLERTAEQFRQREQPMQRS